jgi:hypothetical protein
VGRIPSIIADLLAVARAALELRDVLRRVRSAGQTADRPGTVGAGTADGPGVAGVVQPPGTEAPQPPGEGGP